MMIFRSGSLLINVTHIIVSVILLSRPSSRKTKGSVVSKRIGMKFAE